MANTLRQINQLVENKEPITMLTAYDASFAALMQSAGIDCLLIGDSLGMVVTGYNNTVPVSVETMIYHAAAVARGAPDVWRIVDMPYLSYTTIEQALETAKSLTQQGKAQMVKLEGGNDAQLQVINALHEQSIPICAHLGLTPQTVDKLGGYRTVGRADIERKRLLAQASAVAANGADMLVLECVPPTLAAEISTQLSIPVIGIGCGANTDGQVLVSYDILGLAPFSPYFSKNFLHGKDDIAAAFSAYHQAVKSGAFPEAQHARD